MFYSTLTFFVISEKIHDIGQKTVYFLAGVTRMAHDLCPWLSHIPRVVKPSVTRKLTGAAMDKPPLFQKGG